MKKSTSDCWVQQEHQVERGIQYVAHDTDRRTSNEREYEGQLSQHAHSGRSGFMPGSSGTVADTDQEAVELNISDILNVAS